MMGFADKANGLLSVFDRRLRRARRAARQFAWLRPCGIKTVLDIGANVGRFASKLRLAMPDAMIYAFEPLGDCHRELLTVMSGDARFRAFNIALGETQAEITMNRSEHSPASSLLTMTKLAKELYPHTANLSREQVAVRPLDAVAAELDLQSNVLIKVDVQGYEASVIRGGMETFAKASAVLMEVCFQRLYEGQPLFDDLYELLRPMGFAFKGFQGKTRTDSDGGALFADAIFLRDGFVDRKTV